MVRANSPSWQEGARIRKGVLEMKTKTTIMALLIFLFLGLTGCSSLTRLATFDDKATSQGAEPVLDPDEFEKINLIEELKAGFPVYYYNSGETTNSPETTNSSVDKARKELAEAFEVFNKYGTSERRNAIQERILTASKLRCGRFKNHLRRFQAEMNFGLGSVTTILGGLGAIFTPASTVRALSGSAAITSGVRAEFNENFFYTLATHVITEGIDAKREEIYAKIKQRQKNESRKTYPIQAAVKDAVEYHESCSTIVGFVAAGEAIVENRNPGLKQFKKVFDDLQSGSLTIAKDAKDKTTKFEATFNLDSACPVTLELTRESEGAENGESIIRAKGGTPPYSFFVREESEKTWKELSPETNLTESPIRKYPANSAAKAVTIIVVDQDGNTEKAVID